MICRNAVARDRPNLTIDPALFNVQDRIVTEAKPSLEQLRDQLRQAEAAGDPWRQGIVLNNLGSYFKEKRETATALQYFHKALEFFTALDDAEKKGTVLVNLGGTFLDARDHQRALEMFAMALGTYGALNHTFGQGVALNNMGGVHLGQKAYEEARNQFVLAASFFRSANALAWEAQALENLAAAESGMGNTKGAIESYARALEIWQKQDQFDRQALILNRIASLHASLGDSRRALELHGRALALAQKANNNVVAAASRSSLGRLYFEARNLNAARTEFQAALLSYEELGDKRGQAHMLLSLAKLDIASGQELAGLAAKLFREAGDKSGEQAAAELVPQEPAPLRPSHKDKSA